MNRREFLFRGAGVATLSAMVPRFPIAGARFFEESVGAAAGPVLVVVELAGGNDGLNTVVPYTDPLYASYRPTIAVPANVVLGLDEKLGLNPVMTGLKSLWDAGRVAVVEGVSYPNPNLSHFTARDIWHTADPELGERNGWLGRYADRALASASSINSLLGCAISQSLPRTLLADKVVFPSLTSLASYAYSTDGANPSDARNQLDAFVEQSSVLHEVVNRSDAIEEISRDAASSSATLQSVTSAYVPRAAYPSNSLADALRLCAEIIVGDLGTQILYVTYGGFDSHSAQKPEHDVLLTNVSDSIQAFFDDLDAQGKSSGVLLMTWSEFGRRANENGSLGTDHGTAGVHFVVGDRAKRGIYGIPPQLSNLDGNGNLPWQIDFRSYYGTILSSFLGVPDVAAVLGTGYPNVGFIR